LALLTSTPGQEFHTRDLVRRIHGSPRPVQLALEKLLRQGLVESRRIGPLRMWRMDPANPLYSALRDLYARTVGLVAQLRTSLEREAGVHYAFVFGSYARGDDDVRSDIDVFIVGDLPGPNLLESLQALEVTLGREINPVVWSERELLARAREKAPFLMTLLAEPKIWIVGDEDEFSRRTREVAGTSPRAGSRDTSRPRRRGRQAPSRGTKSRARPVKR
ncbi:MAG TPA: nucleotidyltransferase domain-containing protein, partial [Candidatus Limnocylindria bacterium]|nr:nucleotidyltransferase domain-containing protein [Candidatus Limnocylindria bacterium]